MWKTKLLNVRHCDACQRHKVSTKMYGGKAQPLSIPKRRWESVSMDLLVKLPVTASGHDTFVVFVDRQSKMVRFVPTTEAGLDAKSFAKTLMDNVVRLRGLPRRMSSAFHPQTDGQTERANRTSEEMLRAYVCYAQDDWDEKLACAEFAINNSWQESVQNTPFFLNYGQHPLTPATVQLPSRVPGASEYAEGVARSVKQA
eukprot:858245-Pelagomonas_calceolata.AAC.1